MSLLAQDPPPFDQWAAEAVRDLDGRPAIHVVPPGHSKSVWPALEIVHRNSALHLTARAGDLAGYIYFNLPDPLRRQPILSVLGRLLPSLDEAPAVAVGLLSGVCGPRVSEARSHLSLLATIASMQAANSMQRLRISISDGEVRPVLPDGPRPAPRPFRLPRLAKALEGCPILRGSELSLDPEVTSLLQVPPSAHARAAEIARVAPLLAGGPDGLSPQEILEGIAP